MRHHKSTHGELVILHQGLLHILESASLSTIRIETVLRHFLDIDCEHVLFIVDYDQENGWGLGAKRSFERYIPGNLSSNLHAV
jgi:hypothetical protein